MGDDISGEEEYLTEEESSSEEEDEVEPKTSMPDDTAELIELSNQEVDALQAAWYEFLKSGTACDVADSLFEVAIRFDPSVADMFKTPQVMMGPSLVAGLSELVDAARDGDLLRSKAESMAVRHIGFGINSDRVALFCEAILGLLLNRLGPVNFHSGASLAWRHFLRDVGNIMLSQQALSETHIELITSSWANAEGHTDTATKEEEDSKCSDNNRNAALVKIKIPQTAAEMFVCTANIMGFAEQSIQVLKLILDSWPALVSNARSSHRLQEELDFLVLRLARGREPANLDSFGKIFFTSLRALLPRSWSAKHETAWLWFWQNVSSMIAAKFALSLDRGPRLSGFFKSMSDDQRHLARRNIYDEFFVLAPMGRQYFKQSSARLNFLIDRIFAILVALLENPVQTFDELSLLGLKHIGFGVPVALFGPFVSAVAKVCLPIAGDATTQQAIRFSLSLMARVMMRVITDGSNLTMRAIKANSGGLLRKSLETIGRGKRAEAVIKLQVGVHSISPLMWAIENGSFDAARAIIVDLLTIRADRDCYYYGVNELFERHPDIVHVLCTKATMLLPVLLDGLIWRSHVAETGLRRVNYYIKHLIVDAEGNFSKAIENIAELKDPKITSHPAVVLATELVWRHVAGPTFILQKLWMVFTMIIFVVGQSLQMTGDQTQQHITFICRLFIYSTCWLRYCVTHTIKTGNGYRTGAVIRIKKVPVPSYLMIVDERLNLMLTVALTVVICTDAVWFCWEQGFADDTLGQFTELCPDFLWLHYWYSLATMSTVLLYFSLMLKLAVLHMRLSAFLLVSSRMLEEVFVFVFSVMFTVLAFASALACLDHSNPDFQGFVHAIQSFTLLAWGFYPQVNLVSQLEDPALLFFTGLFVLIVLIFLTNMLIAQICAVYSSYSEDMLGLARLSRMQVIVETMPSASRRLWQRLLRLQSFDDRLEFNAGDLGLAGGLQLLEPASAHPTFTESVLRYGGLSAPEEPWPEESEEPGGSGVETTGSAEDFQALGTRLGSIERILAKLLSDHDVTCSGSNHSSEARRVSRISKSALPSRPVPSVEEDIALAPQQFVH